MRSLIPRFDQNFPLVQEETKIATEVFNLWVRQVTDSGLLIGTGTPETNVEAQQGKFYMDETGAAGSVLYIKQSADIGGDKTQGWVAIG